MKPLTFILALAAMAAAATLADDARGQGNPPGTVTGSFALTGIHQLPADLSGGGDLEWSSLTLSAGVKRQFSSPLAAGVSARYDHEEWPIGAPSAFGTDAPWRRLERAGASVNLSLALSHTLVTGVSPTVEWAWAEGAGGRDALIYGAVLSAANAFTPRFVLGGGASVTRQFYSVKTTPFVIVNWKLTDRLRVANAAPAGPEGGAGVELVVAPAPGWEIAGGGVYRSDRWRLDPDVSGAKNVGETSSIPLLVRVSNAASPRLKLDLYAGVSANSEITVKDDHGRRLAREAYGTVPLVSVMVSSRF